MRGDGVLRQLRVDADVILAPDGAARVAHVDLRGERGGGNEKSSEGNDGPRGFHRHLRNGGDQSTDPIK